MELALFAFLFCAIVKFQVNHCVFCLHPLVFTVCLCTLAGVELLTCLGLPCTHHRPETLLKAGQLPSISFACLLHLAPYLLLSSLHCPPPKCICADGPIFPRPQTGDVIRGNLICLECSGDGRKLFCSSICKCIHHGVSGNPSP